MELGPSGDFDDGRVINSCVIKVGDTLKMWYEGVSVLSGGYGWVNESQIGYATSLDGITWNKYSSNPVLQGGLGSWNSYAVYSPSVVFDGSTYHMWYAGRAENSPTEIGYATSPDGITWTEYTNNPVLPAGGIDGWDWWISDPCVLFDGVTFHMWYWGIASDHKELTGYANSPDGINWTKNDSVVPVIEQKGGNWGEIHIRIGSVIHNQTDSTYRLWYSAEVIDIFRIGFASSDSLLDIAALVENVEVNKTYAVAGSDSICISAKMKNPTGITLIAKIETPDRIVFDSLQLYDDGNHNDGNADDSIFANIWPVLSTEERLYYVDIRVTRIDADTVIQNINNAVLFTTIGPVVFEDYAFHSSDTIPNSGDRLLCKLILKNNGSSTATKNVRAVITCLDTLASLGTNFSSYNDIAAGTEITSDSWYTINISEDCDDGTEIPFRVDIYSDDYIFWSDIFSIDVVADPTNIEESKTLPKEFALEQNYPNPFNPSTTFKYEIPGQARNDNVLVQLIVYDILGREVATLVNEQQKAGYYEVNWNAVNNSSGVYFYKILAGDFVDTKKMILLR